jgi:DUF4097 and DUF4098 domain-containing protein YvlB
MEENLRRRTLVILALFALATSVYGSGRHSGYHGSCGMCISVDDEADLTDCGQLRVTINDRPAIRAEEVVAVGSPRSLVIRAPENGGIHVIGTDSGAYEVRACKAAAFDADISQIKVRMRGNELTADGPDAGKWVVYFLVRAPRGASLDLDSHNGPISLRSVNATVTANAVNGPVSVSDSTGTMNLETQNGPVSLDGGSGTMKLNAQNGPVTVKLRGSYWDGNIEAHTQNGPVSLKIPANFRSGVVVESEGHGPVSCRAAACRDARRTWDDEDSRKIELGSGPAVVRMSTVNGPVSVREND